MTPTPQENRGQEATLRAATKRLHLAPEVPVETAIPEGLSEAREATSESPLRDLLDALDRTIAATGPEGRPGLVVALAARLAGLGAGMTASPATNHTMCEEDRLLTIPEVANRLGVPEEHARELGRRVELPTVRIGRYIRVRPEDLRAFIAKRRFPLDPGRHTAHCEGRGRRGTGGDQDPTQCAAGGLGRAARRHRQHDCRLGAKESARHGAAGNARPPSQSVAEP
jgi:excisionase family DNA binding protein